MKVQIQSVKFDADQRLVDFIQHKMDKMDRFVEGVLSAQVNLKVDKDDELGNKVAVVKMMSPAANWLPNRRLSWSLRFQRVHNRSEPAFRLISEPLPA